MPLDRPWLPLSKYLESSPSKNEPFSQEMHLKILLTSRGLKLSKSKPGCRVSALQFFVIFIPPMAFWLRAHSGECFFSFLSRDLHLFHCWKANWGLKSSSNSQTSNNCHIHIYSLWVMVWLERRVCLYRCCATSINVRQASGGGNSSQTRNHNIHTLSRIAVTWKQGSSEIEEITAATPWAYSRCCFDGSVHRLSYFVKKGLEKS